MTIIRQQVGPIWQISIDRINRRNAVDGPTANLLYQAFLDFEQDHTAKVAILHSHLGHFCAGADLQAVADDNGQGNSLNEDGPGPMGPTRMQLTKPVIAAIDGYAVAGGLELALWCDLRVAAEDATLGVFCRRFGVPLIDGGTVRLPRLIGTSRAMDLILTGRAVTAQEAFDIGLVNRLAPPGNSLETALTLANQLASLPQTCLRHDRQSVYQQSSLTEADAINNEFRLGMKTLASGETLAGAKHFSDGAGRHGKPS